MNGGRPTDAAIRRFDFVLTWYAKEAGCAWLASLAHTYRRGSELCYLIDGSDNVGMVEDVLVAAEAAGVLDRGKVDMDHSTRAFTALTLGGAFRKGQEHHYPARYFAWTLTDLGRGFFAWRGVSNS